MKHIFTSIATKEGKLPELDNDSLKGFIADNAGKRIGLDLYVVEPDKTPQQRKYYWAVVVPKYKDALIDAGWFREGQFTNEDVHELLKSRHLKPRRVYSKDRKHHVTIRTSTERLTKYQYIDYLDAIIQECAEMLGHVIPPPDPEFRMKAEIERIKDNTIT